MVGAAGEDGDGAVELFGEHGAGEGVGPGLRSEGELQVGPDQDRGIEPVRAADDQGEAGDPFIPPAGEAGGELAGGERRPMFVAGDDALMVQPREEGRGFGRLPGASGFDLDEADRREAERAAAGLGAGYPVTGEGGFGRAAQPADADQIELEGQRASSLQFAATPR